MRFLKKSCIRICIISLVYIFLILFFCEYLIYYIVELKCNWPNNVKITGTNPQEPLKAMILADIHMLGPRHGHWFDKLRREWQMYRSFQTAITLFRPEVVFILGDLFDEGQFVNDKEFNEYLKRFYKLFSVPYETKLFGIVGNHDVGFHYRLHPYFIDRFDDNFNNTGVSLYTIKNIHFITINSMAMENDGCHFCEIAFKQLKEISRILNCVKNHEKCRLPNSWSKNTEYSQPIILQHFPMYRLSDEICDEHDSVVIEKYREKWEVLSKEATLLLGDLLNPRLAFSGHSHNYCKLKNILGIEEYTVASFNWRNKVNPSFFLAHFTPHDYLISVCHLPEESTVIISYVIGVLMLLIFIKLYF